MRPKRPPRRRRLFKDTFQMIGSLTLDQLRVLVTIADTGSFSAAGRELHRAQSAISQAVANLERLQEVELFDRRGRRPQLTAVGQVLVDQARQVLATAKRFEAVAAGTRGGLEPELVLAIDPMVPTAPLIASIRALQTEFPHLPVTFSTEGLGGALRRLREQAASLAVCVLLPDVPDDVAAFALMRVPLRAVVSREHPLASLNRPAKRADLELHVQLVLSDPIDPGSPNYGLVGGQRWRFVDLGRRLDFLLAGFGWCRMPLHMVQQALATGQLVAIDIDGDATPAEGLTIFAAHLQAREPGRAGRWLLADLRARLAA